MVNIGQSLVDVDFTVIEILIKKLTEERGGGGTVGIRLKSPVFVTSPPPPPCILNVAQFITTLTIAIPNILYLF